MRPTPLLVLLLAVGAASLTAMPTEAQSPGAGPWSAAVGSPTVALGAPIAVDIQGPANGTYVVTLNVQPFNATAPAWVNVSRLPANGFGENGTVGAEVQIPTHFLSNETVMVSVSNATAGDFAVFYVTLAVSSCPASGCESQQGARENASRIQSLLYDASSYSTWGLAGLVGSCIVSAIAIYIFLAVGTRLGENRYVAMGNRAGHGFLWQRRGSQQTGAWDIESPTPAADPRRVFVAKPAICATCEQPRLRSAVLQHLTVVHRLSQDEAERRIAPSEQAASRVRGSMRAEAERDRASTRGAAAKARDGVDLTDLLSGRKV